LEEYSIWTSSSSIGSGSSGSCSLLFETFIVEEVDGIGDKGSGDAIPLNAQAIAFADDLIVLTRGDTVVEAENYMNIEMKKIMEWATNNRLLFNENKSQNYAYVS